MIDEWNAQLASEAPEASLEELAGGADAAPAALFGLDHRAEFLSR